MLKCMHQIMKRLLFSITSILMYIGCLSACRPLAVPAAPPDAPLPVSASTPQAEGKGWWRPQPGLAWQTQFSDPLEVIPGMQVYTLDLFETTPEQVAELHTRGARVVCYISMGSWEDWRADADLFPESVIGNKYRGWAGERWLDIRRVDLLAPILSARLDLCAAKDFDGVEPDNLDGFLNKTGFALTYDDQLAFNRWVADQAHTRGLAVGLKNDLDQAQDLVAWFDWAVLEECLVEGTCDLANPFPVDGKPVVMMEYTDQRVDREEMCSLAARLGFSAMLKDRELTAWREGCP